MDFKYIEKVDMVLFKKILDNFDELFESGKLGRFVDKNYRVIDNKETIKTIVKKMYFNKLQTNEVEYRFVSKQKEGRLYSKVPSLQGISRVIRHTLARDIYWDVDMQNAHPIILEFYCKENNISCSSLEYYNNNRNECFKSLMDTFNISRDDAKRIPLTSINGGAIYENCPQWMLDFHTELFKIRESICKLNPQYVKRAKDNYNNKLKGREQTLKNPKNKTKNKPLFENINGSACNYLLCKYENIILQCCLNKIEELSFKVGALVFDGFMLYKDESINIENLLATLEQEILKETRIPIKLSVKEMDENINFSSFSKVSESKSIDSFDENGGIIKLDDFVDPDIFNSSPITLIKAGLGRGKSTASITYVNKNHFDKIFIITPRRTYAESICSRFNKESKYKFQLYSDVDYVIDKPQYIVVQCESLHRLRNYTTDGLCVIIDELESFLTQLTSTKTHKKNHLENIRVFEVLCSASKVIGMDAFMSSKSFDVFKNMGLKVDYYNYTKPLIKRTYEQIESKAVSVQSVRGNKNKMDYFTPFAEKIEELVFNGKKMFLFVSSINKLETLKNRLILRGLDKDKIACYCSKEKDDLTDVNNTWITKQVVMCTSSLTVGVNFDVPNYFHSIGIYLSATSRNLVRDVFQSSYRVRHLIDNKMYFSLDTSHYGINESIYRSVIKEELLTKEENILNLFKKYKVDNNELLDKIVWLENLYINNILEYNLSIMDLKNEFFKYLLSCNYEQDTKEDELEAKFMDDVEEVPLIAFKYVDIPSISSDEMKRLRRLEVKTDLDTAKLEKFYFQQQILDRPEKDEIHCWDIYLSNKKKFRNISYEKGITIKSITLGDILKTTLPIFAEKMSLQLEVIQDLNTWYGVQHTHDIDRTIEKKNLELLVPIFKENMERIYEAFDLKDRRDDDSKELTTTNVVRITNKVLSKWGFSTLKRNKREKKRINGIQDYSSTSFKIEVNEDVYDMVRPKGMPKEDTPIKKLM